LRIASRSLTLAQISLPDAMLTLADPTGTIMCRSDRGIITGGRAFNAV
jgi:hypothetical protein